MATASGSIRRAPNVNRRAHPAYGADATADVLTREGAGAAHVHLACQREFEVADPLTSDVDVADRRLSVRKILATRPFASVRSSSRRCASPSRSTSPSFPTRSWICQRAFSAGYPGRSRRAVVGERPVHCAPDEPVLRPPPDERPGDGRAGNAAAPRPEQGATVFGRPPWTCKPPSPRSVHGPGSVAEQDEGCPVARMADSTVATAPNRCRCASWSALPAAGGASRKLPSRQRTGRAGRSGSARRDRSQPCRSIAARIPHAVAASSAVGCELPRCPAACTATSVFEHLSTVYPYLPTPIMRAGGIRRPPEDSQQNGKMHRPVDQRRPVAPIRRGREPSGQWLYGRCP